MRKKNQPRKTQTKRKSNSAKGSLRIINYKIVYEPIFSEQYEGLPDFVKKQMEELFDFIDSNPNKAIAILLALSQEYPDVPEFKHFLVESYSMIDEDDKVAEVSIDSYQKHPNFLLAKIDYAVLCLEEGESEKITEIFDNKLDLQLLYPHRKKFHIAEFHGFTNVMAMYHLYINEYEQAKRYYSLLKQIVPDLPSTRILGEQIRLAAPSKK